MQDPQGTLPVEPAAPQDSTEPVVSAEQVEVPQEPVAPAPEELARHFQSIADQRQALNYQLQAQVKQLQEQLSTRSAPQTDVQKNPYDPSNWTEWLRWETQAAARLASEQTAKMLIERAQEMQRVSAEAQWQAEHPNVDINAVKAFSQIRGIQSLDDAYIVMTQGQSMNAAAANAIQRTYNQIRQTPNAATPLRGQPAPGPQPKVSFEETLKRWNENPAIENSWTPEFKNAFEQELNYRDRMYKSQGL